MIHSFAIYLSFDFSIKCYYCLCGPLDKCCGQICAKWAKRRNIQVKTNDLEIGLLAKQKRSEATYRYETDDEK